MAKPKPLTAFVSKLCGDTEVVSVLKKYLAESGEDAARVIKRLKSGRASKKDKELAADCLSDLIHNNSTSETLFYKSHGDDAEWWPIIIEEYGGVF